MLHLYVSRSEAGTQTGNGVIFRGLLTPRRTVVMYIAVMHPSVLMARIITLILSDSGHEVSAVATPSALLDHLSEYESHAVIIGIDSQRFNSLQLCKEIRAVRYSGPIIFVSRSDDHDDKLKAFEHGIDDYIIDPFLPEEFLARVEVAARRHRNNDNQPLGSVISIDDAELSIGDMIFRRGDGDPISLTPTEMRLLERLMRNAGITISRDTLIERTWGYECFGDSNRVDVYIARIRKKIEPDPANPRYLHTVRGVGYVFRVDNTSGQHLDLMPSGPVPPSHLSDSNWPRLAAH
jgi:two-component system, OmpR family, response regulator RegX3